MHHPHSIHYVFDRDSIGWLHRRHERGEEISKEDVIRLWEAADENQTDPLLRHYVSLTMKGQLKGRSGRPKRTAQQLMKLRIADVLVEECASDIREERRARGVVPGRVLLEPRREAAGKVARYLEMNISDLSLLNAISLMNNGRL